MTIGTYIDRIVDGLCGTTTNEAVTERTISINYQKGISFEEYVIKMFDQKYFAVHDWTRDISGKTHGIVVESDSNPDLVMRYKPKDQYFAVECKYRSQLYKGKLEWTTSKKLFGYKAYMKRLNIPTFIVIGLGGIPTVPERMFCIPLQSAVYPALYPSIFEKYERNLEKNFFWNGTILK